MGTKQPQIARLESGLGNPRMSTLVELAEALDATVRVDLAPTEVLRYESPHAPWWIQGDAQQGSVPALPFGELNLVFVSNNNYNIFLHAGEGRIAEFETLPESVPTQASARLLTSGS
jgi:transcriptional regulator with XRE-family HTH domain